jgi:hypothetical protein
MAANAFAGRGKIEAILEERGSDSSCAKTGIFSRASLRRSTAIGRYVAGIGAAPITANPIHRNDGTQF